VVSGEDFRSLWVGRGGQRTPLDSKFVSCLGMVVSVSVPGGKGWPDSPDLVDRGWQCYELESPRGHRC
jgi:hypothetical protein